MKSITEANPGLYEIKWMFGNKDIINLLHSHNIQEGSYIQVILQFKDYVMVGCNNHRFILENEAAWGIKV